MALLDLLGRRWTLRIMWELREGPVGFRDLRERCEEMSPSVLSQRLSELTGAGILEASDGGRYLLTPAGRELGSNLTRLDAWAKRHAELL